MGDDLYKKIFSNNLRFYMNQCNKSQIDIVNDLGFDKSAVSTWVNGSRLPRMDKVDALAKYLCIRRSDLIEERLPAASSEESATKDDLVAQRTQEALKFYSLIEKASPEVRSAVELLLQSVQ